MPAIPSSHARGSWCQLSTSLTQQFFRSDKIRGFSAIVPPRSSHYLRMWGMWSSTENTPKHRSHCETVRWATNKFVYKQRQKKRLFHFSVRFCAARRLRTWCMRLQCHHKQPSNQRPGHFKILLVLIFNRTRGWQHPSKRRRSHVRCAWPC